jgi:hypothetical protein
MLTSAAVLADEMGGRVEAHNPGQSPFDRSKGTFTKWFSGSLCSDSWVLRMAAMLSSA